MTTLENFLLKNGACADVYQFAKDLTLEQFLATCDRGDWILWLYAKINPDKIKELTLAKQYAAAARDIRGYAQAVGYYDSSKSAANHNAAQLADQKITADICRTYLPLEIWNF